jgi:site-specific recombinase XerD
MKKPRLFSKIAIWATSLVKKIRRKRSKKAPLKIGKLTPKAIARVRPEIEEEAFFAPKSPVEELSKRNFFEAADEFSQIQLSPHTKRAYSNDLRGFFSYALLRGVKASNWTSTFTPKLIADFRDWLVNDQKLAKSTATRKLAVVKSFFRWARSTQLLTVDPSEMVKSFPQTQESKTGYLSRPQIRRLLADFNDLSDMGLFRSLSKVVVETLLMLGLRRSEAASILVSDLQFTHDEWLLRVRGKGDRERLLPMPPKLLTRWSQWLRRIHADFPTLDFDQGPAEVLRWIGQHKDTPLLVSTRSRETLKAISTSEIAHIVRKASRRAGIVNRVSPHMLRATAITFALDEGATHRGVQQMAGWTSPLMISRYDKRLKDPKFSGLRHLKYAFEELEDESLMDAEKSEGAGLKTQVPAPVET